MQSSLSTEDLQLYSFRQDSSFWGFRPYPSAPTWHPTRAGCFCLYLLNGDNLQCPGWCLAYSRSSLVSRFVVEWMNEWMIPSNKYLQLNFSRKNCWLPSPWLQTCSSLYFFNLGTWRHHPPSYSVSLIPFFPLLPTSDPSGVLWLFFCDVAWVCLLSTITATLI